MPSLAAALRRAGYRRLAVYTLAGTQFARELTKAGFVRRNEGASLMGYALTALGEEALRAAANWEITELDCDR
jgi:predicted transcriptional regulator